MKIDIKRILKIKTQQLGAMLSSMIMPIIGIIIAWGLLTAFFIPTGWAPVKIIEENIVGPIISYLIPVLIGFLGGKQIYGLRGGFLGAAATMGAIGGANLLESGFYGVEAKLGVQFLGAMIIGPLSAFVFKKIEVLWEGKIKVGFEMLVNNLSMGIIAFIAILFGFFVIPWIVFTLTFILNGIIDPLTKHKVLPVVSIFVEPAKPLFLNNAINHGIFTPLATSQVENVGESILYYIESNPGPGMGILLGYILMDKKQRGSASSASVIHFFGGIHEVYFPFIIMRPILIIAAICGGVTGVTIMQIFSVGAVAPASPGSIIALILVSAKGVWNYIGLILAVLGSMAVSFIVSVFLLKYSKNKTLNPLDAIQKMNIRKNQIGKNAKIQKIIFACDAGMGSSVMGAGLLKKIFKKANINIQIANKSIKDLHNENMDLVVVHPKLADRAKKENNAKQYIVNNFLEENQYKNLVELLINQNELQKTTKIIETQAKEKFLKENMIELHGIEKTMTDAINKAGKILYDNQCIKKDYIQDMILRNKDVSVYIGNGVAIPHGTSESKDKIIQNGLSIITYPQGIDWKGKQVYVVIGIAAKDEQHMNLISQIGTILSNEANVDKIIKSTDKETIMKVMNV